MSLHNEIYIIWNLGIKLSIVKCKVTKRRSIQDKRFGMEEMMKKRMIAKLSLVSCLVLGMMTSPQSRLTVQAEEVMATVQGSVMSGTTTNLLKLSTREGNMEIKLDSTTDTTACKILLAGKDISVSVSHGSDGYLHAVKITSGAQDASVTLDSSTNVYVTGTIGDKSSEELLYVNTAQGEMQIKLDTTTDISGCAVLVNAQEYRIYCSRGSDGYMHALSISDASAAIGQGNPAAATVQAADLSLTPTPATVVTAETTTVTGTVGKNTREDLLYLSTDNGEMQIVIDKNTDTRNGMFLMPDAKLTVSVYKGSDSNMHAAVIVGSKNMTQPPEVDASSPAAVIGTVDGRSNDNILYLKTSAGDMELKLDTVRSVTGCKAFVTDKKLKVTCVRGSDAYMHALDITVAD